MKFQKSDLCIRIIIFHFFAWNPFHCASRLFILSVPTGSAIWKSFFDSAAGATEPSLSALLYALYLRVSAVCGDEINLIQFFDSLYVLQSSASGHGCYLAIHAFRYWKKCRYRNPSEGFAAFKIKLIKFPTNICASLINHTAKTALAHVRAPRYLKMFLFNCQCHLASCASF